MAANDADLWTCPGCGRERATKFCADCGEKRLGPRDLTLHDLIRQLWHEISSLDARLFRSLRVLLTQPGALTAAHVRGRRRFYLGPLQMFFFANALFFTVQSLTHANIFSSTLDSHLHGQDWGDIAQALLNERLAARHMTLAAYAPLFDQAVLLNAKALIILMALAFSILLPIAFMGQHKPFGAHVVFALHMYGFILLLFSAVLIVLQLDVMRGGQGLMSSQVDAAVSLFNLAACAVYLHIASRRVYQGAGVLALIRTCALAVALAALVPGYRFLIFLITIYTT
jgi:hypothetical protein